MSILESGSEKGASRISHLQSSQIAMSACLLTWNPEKWTWHELPTVAELIGEEGPQQRRWSSGNTKREEMIGEGDRVFLLRQRVAPTGIIGSGKVVVPPYQAPHWNEERRKQGEEANFVQVKFDALLVPGVDPILTRDRLRNEPELSEVDWGIPASGTTISEEEADALERLWRVHLDQLGLEIQEVDILDAGESGKPDRVQHEVLRIVRDPVHSRKVKEENNYQCQVCDEILSLPNGDRYAEAHHVHPLGEGGDDTKANIMCVCPNCHALLDYGAIRFNPEKIDGVGRKYIEYHNEEVYAGE